ncbi:NUDIX domain-containing protein [Bisporella sp. PMI_857]|nr:NUDIX domain-containing protein [Bisporella sp. PMI_857]
MAQTSQPKSFLDLVNIVDNVPYDFDFSALYKLLLPEDSRPHGLILPNIVSQIPWSSRFAIDHDVLTVKVIDDTNGKDIAKSCNIAFQETVDAIVDKQLFRSVAKHSEMFKVMGANQNVVYERFTSSLFGLASRGAHMTAFVRTPEGIKIWVPRRSKHLKTYPDMLDTTVAGGVKADDTPFACIVAESDEEASLPRDYVRENACSIGVLTHVAESNYTKSVYSQVLYLYELELPETIIPKPGDDEVEIFHLWTVDEVKQAMMRQEFKPNSSLVMIDFFIRHGIITPDNDDAYAEITMRLRRHLPVAITPEKRSP